MPATRARSRACPRRAAELSGLPPADVTTLRRAALVHDLGMNGLPATILDKPGPLTASETERMRMHAYYTDRMLARPPALDRIGAIAALATERLDGSGYHRGLVGRVDPRHGTDPRRRRCLPGDARTPAVPRRPCRIEGGRVTELRAEVRAGRLAADAVDAVLDAAGQRRGKRQSGPSGLTAREVEVLVLIARGASNKQVARLLGIAPKTAGTHIERIYSKIGASTRSTATLFAMQQGLLDLRTARFVGRSPDDIGRSQFVACTPVQSHRRMPMAVKAAGLPTIPLVAPVDDQDPARKAAESLVDAIAARDYARLVRRPGSRLPLPIPDPDPVTGTSAGAADVAAKYFEWFGDAVDARCPGSPRRADRRPDVGPVPVPPPQR